MDIRPITTDADHEEALAEIKRLWGAEPGTAERNLLEVWAMLAHHYERERRPLPPLDPVEAIKFRLDQLGLERKALIPIFGTTGRISEILASKRSLTLAQILALHERLEIPLDSLIVARKKKKAPGGARGSTPRRTKHSGRAA